MANAADRVRSAAWRSLSSERRREYARLAELDVRRICDLRILVDGAPPLLSQCVRVSAVAAAVCLGGTLVGVVILHSTGLR